MKTKFIGIRTTPADRQRLEAAAQACGLTLSAFIRAAVIPRQAPADLTDTWAAELDRHDEPGLARAMREDAESLRAGRTEDTNG